MPRKFPGPIGPVVDDARQKQKILKKYGNAAIHGVNMIKYIPGASQLPTVPPLKFKKGGVVKVKVRRKR